MKTMARSRQLQKPSQVTYDGMAPSLPFTSSPCCFWDRAKAGTDPYWVCKSAWLI